MQEVEDQRQWSKGLNVAVLEKLKENTSIAVLLAQLLNTEVDSLFEEVPTPPVHVKRKIETVAMESRDVDKDISNALNKSTSGGGGGALKRSKADAEAVVDEWFASFHENGKAGHIGLVPECLQNDYPTNAPDSLDETLKEHLIHFYEWLQKKN